MARHVSIGIVTNPWKAAPNSPEQAGKRRRQAAGSRRSAPGFRFGNFAHFRYGRAAQNSARVGLAQVRITTRRFSTINLGESPAERHYRELQDRIRRHIRKQYVIGVVSGKGGVGKTTMTACIGAVFRECRPENVVAIDAAPGFGTLAGRIDEAPPGDYTAVLNDTDVQGYADIREHLGQNSFGLDVLAGNRASDQPRPLVPSMFTGVLSRLRRTHTVIVVDTSDDLEHPVMKAVFDACDTLGFRLGPDRRHFAAGDARHRSAAVDGLSRIGVSQHGRSQRQPRQIRLPTHAPISPNGSPVRRDGRIHAVRPAPRQRRDHRYAARIAKRKPGCGYSK